MSCRTKIDNPEIITVFASSLLLNVCIAAVVMRQQRRHALSWGFGVRFAVSLFLAWLFYWHGLGWNTVKVAVLLAVVGVPFGTATIMMRCRHHRTAGCARCLGLRDRVFGRPSHAADWDLGARHNRRLPVILPPNLRLHPTAAACALGRVESEPRGRRG